VIASAPPLLLDLAEPAEEQEHIADAPDLVGPVRLRRAHLSESLAPTRLAKHACRHADQDPDGPSLCPSSSLNKSVSALPRNDNRVTGRPSREGTGNEVTPPSGRNGLATPPYCESTPLRLKMIFLKVVLKSTAARSFPRQCDGQTEFLIDGMCDVRRKFTTCSADCKSET